MSSPQIFDRALLRTRRARLAAGLDHAGFLLDEIAARLAERLGDMRRRFPLALDLGCHTGQLARRLEGCGGIERLVRSDLSAAMAIRAGAPALVADEEALPFGADRFDVVLSSCALHWVNDLPGALAQIRYALRPDGLFLAAVPGGDTLIELREVLMTAELELTGGAAPRVSPFTDVRDAGMLLQRAGFALPVVDLDTIVVTYSQPFQLFADLRAMGQSGALIERSSKPLGRAVLARTCALYQERFGDSRGRVPATFQVLMLTGWKPDPGQPQPLRRGSGRIDLAGALGHASSPAARKEP